MAQQDHDLEIVSSKSIHIGKTKGEGYFGVVIHGHHEHWGDVAFKKLKTNFLEQKVRERLIREAEKLNVLSHPNIIQMLGVVMENGCYGLVLEYMPYGALDTFIESHETTWPMKLDFIEGITLGMNYLHTYSSLIIHRDLKPPNVLVGRDLRVKITDFGLSMWRSCSTNSLRRMGTVTHVPPEGYNINLEPRPTYDIYSFAVLVWEVCTQQIPFQGIANELIKQAVCDGQRPSLSLLPLDTPDVLHSVIEDCWTHDPEFRPAFHIIKQALERDTTRQGLDMQKERLSLMHRVAESGQYINRTKDNGAMRAVEHEFGTLNIDCPVHGFDQSAGCEIEPEQPASQQCDASLISKNLNLTLSDQAQAIDRQFKQYVNPAQPASADFPPGFLLNHNCPQQPPTLAHWNQYDSIHVNSMTEPDIDGLDDSLNVNGSGSNLSNSHLLRDNAASRQAGPSNGGSSSSQGASQVQYIRRHDINSAPAMNQGITHDAEADAEPDSMQSMHSPQENRSFVSDSYTGRGIQAGSSHRQGSHASPAPRHPHPSPSHPHNQGQRAPHSSGQTGPNPTFQARTPNQQMQDYMREWLPKVNQQMQDLPNCSNYVVHTSDEGTTVICSSDGSKKKGNAIMIGANNTMNFYAGPVHQGSRLSTGTGSPRHRAPAQARPANIRKPPVVNSKKPLDEDTIELMSKHLGRYWKALGRKLGFSSGQLDQINHDFQVDGLEEKIYQMMTRWKEKEGRAATIGLLAEKLWLIERYPLVAQLKG